MCAVLGDHLTLHPPLDDDAAATWDEHLRGWPHAHLLQTYGWGNVQAGAGWKAHRLIVSVPGAAAPLPVSVLESRRPAPFARLGWTGLYVPKGPACDASDGSAWEAVLAALAELARRTGAGAVTLEPPGWDDQTAPLRTRLGARGWSEVATVQPAHTTVVDLGGGFEAVLSRMRPKGRYNVRLAGRRGVVVERPDDPEVAAQLLGQLCAATAARQDIHQPDAAFVRMVLDAVPSAAVHIASVDGEPVAGALVAHFAGEAVYLYGGSTDRHRDRQPSALLHASILEAAIAAGCDSYDLWGIPPAGDPAHPWHGLRQFKLSLGGVERSAAGAWRWVRRPAAVRAGDILDGVWRHARRRPARRRSQAVERGGHGDRTGEPTPEEG